jgi:hypothetical protein
MPKTKKNPYVIDTKMFLNEWYQAVNSTPRKTMEELVAILQIQCDSDPKNAGHSKTLTASMLSGKMNYYRRSWDIKMIKPAMPDNTGGDRKATKDATIKRFREAGLVE